MNIPGVFLTGKVVPPASVYTGERAAFSATQNAPRKPFRGVSGPHIQWVSTNQPRSATLQRPKQTKFTLEGGNFSGRAFEGAIFEVLRGKKQNSPTENVTRLVLVFVCFFLSAEVWWALVVFFWSVGAPHFGDARFLRKDKVCLGPVVKVGWGRGWFGIF